MNFGLRTLYFASDCCFAKIGAGFALQGDQWSGRLKAQAQSTKFNIRLSLMSLTRLRLLLDNARRYENFKISSTRISSPTRNCLLRARQTRATGTRRNLASR